ncbi:hypothetical protein, partial [Polaribacter sp.]|uniref:hypothetical protein n=1 Tax=Polaribacter sp. TaxID=1920175 RepID=UPI003F6AF518
MKKITLLLIIGILLTYSNQSFSQTFDLSTGTTTDNTPTNVSETLSGITMTLAAKNNGVDDTAILTNAAFGTNQVAFHQFSSQTADEMIISFNQAVNVDNIRVISTESHTRTWTFTPTGGSNTTVTKTSSFSGGEIVTLNYTNITQITITTDSPFSASERMVFDYLTLAASNTAPVIGNTAAGQTVNDNATINPFSSITTTDADGDNLSATITLDNNAKGVLTGTGLSGTGPYTIASTSPADLQTKLRALSYNPTDNRTAVSETTTFTVAIDDGTDTDSDNTTTVISSAVAPTVTSVSVPSNATYTAGQNLDFTVNFNENITVSTAGGTPQIAITIGATVRQAS